MNIYAKSSLRGVLGYLSIMIISCVVNNPGSSIASSPFSALLLCSLFGPFMWIPYLIGPAIFLIAVFLVFRIKKSDITFASLISSTMIIYGINLALGEYVFEIFKSGIELWKFILVTVISCFFSSIYVILKRPNKEN